jgi:hypothetical protein
MMVTDKIYFCVSFLRSLHEELAIVDYSLPDMKYFWTQDTAIPGQLV